MGKNIVLTGFMGAGKSTVGRIIARALGMRFVDLDEEIEKKAGMSIPEIFSKYGEEHFRDIESEIIKEVSSLSNAVIVTGGGAVIREENRKMLRENGVIVYLHVEPEEAFRRLKDDTSRPLLRVENPLQRIKELMDKRKEFYRDNDFEVDTTGLSPEEVAEEVIKRIKTKN